MKKQNKVQVKWKESTRSKANAGDVFNFFEKVREANDGELNIDYAVEASREKNSPLHNELEWDDSIAGHEFRKNQVKYLVRNIEIVRADVSTNSRAYESIKVNVVNSETKEVKEKNVFLFTEDILSSPAGRAQLLGQAIRDAIAFRKRYSGLSELACIIQVIDSEMVNLEKKIKKVV